MRRRPLRAEIGNLSLASGSSSPASSTSSGRASDSRRSSCSRMRAAKSWCRARPAAASRPTIRATGRRAKRLARQAIEAFEDCDYVVAPSGSCGGMLIKHYPDLFAGEPDLAARAERFARESARTDQLPRRRHGRRQGRGALRGNRRLSRFLRGPARTRGQGAAAPAAGRGRGPDAGRAQGSARPAAASAACSRPNTASSRTRSSEAKPTTSAPPAPTPCSRAISAA